VVYRWSWHIEEEVSMKLQRPFTLFLLARVSVLIALVLAQGLLPGLVTAADPAWRGEYFANQDLAGNPILVRVDGDINFDWALGSPGSGIPSDHFSVRWTRAVYLPAGEWRFNVTVDDGVRLWVDGQLLIDQWHISAPVTYSGNISLGSGDHNVRVEYFENTERAQVQVWWVQSSVTPTPTPAPSGAHPWDAAYYDNVYLTGNPRFTRYDASINFDWGADGPGGGIGGEGFSVRWNRRADFTAAPYEFTVKVDDGVRFWLDDDLLIDEWHDSAGKTYSRQVDVAAGGHNLRVEYYQGGGDALIGFGFQRAGISWEGNLYTCMAPQDSWVKVYRLTPDNVWEDRKPAGWGPISASGEIKIDGLPVDPYYGMNGQPYRVELWINSKVVQTEGDINAGQPYFRIAPGQDARTSWPCGSAIVPQGKGPPE
jgi:PA14 domain